MQNRELEITNRILDYKLQSNLIQFIRETNLSNDEFYKLLDMLEHNADKPLRELQEKIDSLKNA